MGTWPNLRTIYFHEHKITRRELGLKFEPGSRRHTAPSMINLLTENVHRTVLEIFPKYFKYFDLF